MRGASGRRPGASKKEPRSGSVGFAGVWPLAPGPFAEAC